MFYKLNVMKNYKLYGCLGILMIAATLTSCSSDDNNDGGENSSQTAVYTWSKDGGLNACDHILFTNGKEDANGKEIGNGDQELVFKGKQTLKKGTYLLK